MPTDPLHSVPSDASNSRPVLDPLSRFSEILFGLIMALTITGSLSAATAARHDVRTMLFAAMGCNIAWGFVDAVMYLLSQFAQRGRELAALRSIQNAPDPQHARALIVQGLEETIARHLPPPQVESLRAAICEMPSPPRARLLGGADFARAASVFCLVVLATLPVVVPFIILSDAKVAMRVSNAIALVMLFVCGYRLGQYANRSPWTIGAVMTVLGAVLVSLTIALGG